MTGNFNPHTRERCDELPAGIVWGGRIFQPTHPWKVWLSTCVLDIPYWISTHTPVKGVTHKMTQLTLFPEISTHTPVKGVTDRWDPSFKTGLISTHTPVKGVTALKWVLSLHREISTHTPVKGVTHAVKVIQKLTKDFNPHTRERCDSTMEQPIPPKHMNFNPHTRERCDWPTSRYFTVNSAISTHTPVKGVTQRHTGASFNENFNPHTRERCDGRLTAEDRRSIISTHTPVKGVTGLQI